MSSPSKNYPPPYSTPSPQPQRVNTTVLPMVNVVTPGPVLPPPLPESTYPSAPQDLPPPYTTPLYPPIDDVPLKPSLDEENTDEKEDKPEAPLPVPTVQPAVGPEPTHMVCVCCRADITTRIQRKVTLKNHIVFLLCCLVGCWPCACVPYCMDSCQNADHYCPKCDAYIGTYAS